MVSEQSLTGCHSLNRQRNHNEGYQLIPLNNTELADAVVALGVGYSEPHAVIVNGNDYWLYTSEKKQKLSRMSAFGFVRDWRVAGALEQLVIDKEWIFNVDHEGSTTIFCADAYFDSTGTDLCRNRIEACIKALT